MATFTLAIDQFNARAVNQIKLACQAIAMDCWGRVVYRTPVGQPDIWRSARLRAWARRVGYRGGRLRANWGCQVGSPYTGVTNDIDMNGSSTIAKANAVTRTWNPRVTSIFLMNNLPYVRKIEYEGHSTQAPAGMVRISVAELDNGAAEAAARI